MENNIIADVCKNCKCNIFIGKTYYDINGNAICEECIDEYKRKESEEYDTERLFT